MKQFKIFREFMVPGRYTKKASATVAGDPLQHDLIVLVGNENNNHWYSMVVDNRENRQKVIPYRPIFGRPLLGHWTLCVHL